MSKEVANLLPIAVLLIFAYLLFIRPARKRARDVTELQNALSVGDEVMLTSGIFAQVSGVVDEKVQVEIAPGVVITVHRGAISKIVRDVPADTSADDTSDDAPYERGADDITDPDDPDTNSRGAI